MPDKLIKLFREWRIKWHLRNVPDDVCCCGGMIDETGRGDGGDICYHGGCRSLKEYTITSFIEKGGKL